MIALQNPLALDMGSIRFMDIETLEDLKNLEGKLVILNENYSEVASYELAIN